jgi:hypothetical protein
MKYLTLMLLSSTILLAPLFNSIYAQPPESNWTGSVPIVPRINELVHTETNINLTEAISRAVDYVGQNASTDSASLVVAKGFLVYSVIVLDAANNLHRIIIDAGDGRVLADEPVSPTVPGIPEPVSPTPPGTVNNNTR